MLHKRIKCFPKTKRKLQHHLFLREQKSDYIVNGCLPFSFLNPKVGCSMELVEIDPEKWNTTSSRASSLTRKQNSCATEDISINTRIGMTTT
jgi:hypothetical protein